jgi:nicotinamide-nucleotide amidase
MTRTGEPGGDQPRLDVESLLGQLSARGETLAVAESLTGGLLAATIVDVPGASAVFRGGLVVYATDLKASVAGVDQALLALRGPVDPQVAVQLAVGARRVCRSDWGLATTGVAGPETQSGRSAGTVFVGLAPPSGPGQARELSISGDRGTVRRGAVEAALLMLADALGG